jgi:hypothetical protein
MRIIRRTFILLLVLLSVGSGIPICAAEASPWVDGTITVDPEKVALITPETAGFALLDGRPCDGGSI